MPKLTIWAMVLVIYASQPHQSGDWCDLFYVCCKHSWGVHCSFVGILVLSIPFHSSACWLLFWSCHISDIYLIFAKNVFCRCLPRKYLASAPFSCKFFMLLIKAGQSPFQRYHHSGSFFYILYISSYELNHQYQLINIKILRILG
jgi:hypothetical protein